ncbi:MAG: hypothetical protein AAF990_00645 [Bacteroidota bacterium]
MRQQNVMLTQRGDQVFTLIKSLTKSEKRNFKLYANRINSAEDLKFIQLFDALDKMDDYEEALLFKKMKGLKRSQLSNLKRHLYKQILTSLRLIHISKNIDIQIREQLDFARILYGKGLHIQSLKLLDRIKTLAVDNHQDLLLMEILDFQKLIEERHITRSRRVKGKVEGLLRESAERSQIIQNTCRLSNLKIKIHGWYIQIGHAKNEKDRLMVEEYFQSNLPKNLHISKMTFFEKIALYQSYVWYHYILLDFRQCYRYALKWTQLFNADPDLKKVDPDLYMRGMHYVLTALYNMGAYKKFSQALTEFEAFEQESQKSFSTISKTISFLYIYTSKINKHYLEGTFQEGLHLVPIIKRLIKRYEKHIDPHRVMVFNYKIAYLYMAAGLFDSALDHLNEIINVKVGHLREDIQSYARLLHLIVHFEIGNYVLLDYLANSVHRFLDKVEELNKMQTETIRFIRQIIKLPISEHPKAFKEFHAVLKKLQKDAFEKRAFLYLDITSWVESKIQGKALREIVRNKFRADENTPRQ